MADYRPESGFGWLDVDEAASERAATLIKAFEESSTLDPVGLGPVRDAFSDLLFPGTSTIQTRLRYFLFIPWICRELERDGTSPAEFRSKLKDREARLIDCLKHLGANRGVIGRISGSNLRRMPSEAYWGGLGKWGIRQLDVSIGEYGRRIDTFRGSRVERDDDGNPVVRSGSMWAAFPEPPEGFLRADADLSLTVEEAEFVVGRIRQRHPTSLLAEFLASPGTAGDARMPWDVPTDVLTDDMRRVLWHAEAVSEMTVGVQHLYNLLLAERAAKELGWDTTRLKEELELDIAAWAEAISDRPDFGGWAHGELEEFWAIVQRRGPIAKPTHDFITDVVRLSASDPAGIATNERLRALVTDRECRLKGSRARLGPRAALESWDQARFGGQLEYRWPTARSYLADLAAASGDQGAAA